MDEKSCASAASAADDDNELLGIRQLLWGSTIKHDVFNRWSQGKLFYFVQCFFSVVDSLQFVEKKWFVYLRPIKNCVGFEFSDIEPSALVQRQGGPCGVLAPVQAFLLKILLMETPGYNISDVSSLNLEYVFHQIWFVWIRLANSFFSHFLLIFFFLMTS